MRRGLVVGPEPLPCGRAAGTSALLTIVPQSSVSWEMKSPDGQEGGSGFGAMGVNLPPMVSLRCRSYTMSTAHDASPFKVATVAERSRESLIDFRSCATASFSRFFELAACFLSATGDVTGPWKLSSQETPFRSLSVPSGDDTCARLASSTNKLSSVGTVPASAESSSPRISSQKRRTLRAQLTCLAASVFVRLRLDRAMGTARICLPWWPEQRLHRCSGRA